ncbi:MAG: patatin-like phospholipase family protein [Deltaproteobacteria bacterium]|nr:patatin-like phospholipase family protein [Deltaproteobacteria bacterium]
MGFLPTITRATATAPRASRHRKKKTALVCAGGGVTGAVYEIGVIRALAACLPERQLNEFDMYVGVSAGAFVSAFLANRVSSEELFRSLAGCSKTIESVRRSDIFKLNWSELFIRGAASPLVAARAAYTYARASEDITITDAVMMLGESLPSAFLCNSKLEGFVHRNLKKHGRTDDFRELHNELYIPAVNLDTGARVVFGEPPYRHIPISKAVRASSALPIAFRPARIEGADYIDGATEKNFHLDVAIAHGAELIVCVNPLVPLMNDPGQVAVPLLFGKHGRGAPRFLAHKGLATVIDQAFRLILHSRMKVGFERAVEKAPHVDIIMFEPDAQDYKMFFYNILRYSARIIIAKHGYEAARQIIEKSYPELVDVFARYDMPLSRDLLDQAHEQMQQGGGSIAAAVAALSGRLGKIKGRIRKKEGSKIIEIPVSAVA